VDARLYNLRHQLLSTAELGDGGPVAGIRLFDPMGLGRDAAGNVLVSDRGGGGSGRVIWRLGTDGTGRIVAGTGRRGTAPIGIPARRSDLGSPQSLCLDATGRVYFADSYNHVILRIEEDGTLRRIAGIGRPGAGGDGGPATAAALNQPYDVRLDSDGSLYIADFGNHRIRKVTPDGLMHTVAGRGEAGYTGDGGLATAARVHGPYGVYADARIGLLIADSHNHVIRVVDRRGYIRTLAGTGRRGLAGDGGPALSASFDTPQALWVSGSGAIYIGDEHNHAIRVIGPDGLVRRLAGTGAPGFSPDGTPADSSRLDDPENILFSSDGAVLFTEAGSGRVRYVGPDGRLGTIAGGAR
jgi:sugar lactone lactonase YvrE